MDILYNVEDKPPLGTSILLAAQHLLAALSAIITVPLVIGGVLKLPVADIVVLVNAAMLISGVVTIIQCKGLGPVGIRLPCVMGTSFTFVGVSIAIGFEYGVEGILGSALVASLVMIIGSFFMPIIRKFFPPIVTGTVVTLIGLSLVPVAIDWFAGGQVGQDDYASLSNLAIGLLVLATVVTLSIFGKGILSAAAVVIGMLVGYLVCLALGVIDFKPVESSPLFALPSPFHFGLSFPISGIIGMSIAYLVTIVESTGDFLALSNVTKTKLTGKKLSSGILCDGLGSALASVFSTTPFSSFSQNVGIVGMTGVASRYVVAITGAMLVLAGLFPVLGAMIVSIPLPVLGGAGLVMFAMIITAGVNILSTTQHTKRNGMIIAVSIATGMAVTVRPELLSHLPEFLKVILASGITTGSIIALLLNVVLPNADIITDTE
ncbi:nucleobase:cation symporter-2 family protein [Colwellia sp. 1_MG-2023]|uniref:nucleobase:cation symporter-2 family protein n=1 Tax=unclassified Colwellia TaxID=196834 RepID=UPI001C0A1A27|nr:MULTISPECIES: nucleobase:cation symporter-2 family protein [unclassified Colwellia]MBU2923892.1 purine permease [Colwellia sp. C2M11]MDO6653036.1 nucleobase:cation symporter-2 family protein [Colwellia sp. 3_MG-2023]MDO6665977.1 nucleobase:cation symporter-2 family protein [Colwellia sp. 2_MG-2023]MDO6690350.1 nucleobase:cation symporter-2 family protein [Colwellia sp. 1_MG-2023]